MEKRLKKAYLDEAKRDKILSEIEADRQSLNANVEKLRGELSISIDDIETLQAVSPEWCKDYVKQAEESYLQNLSAFVVKTVQNDVHDKFRAAYEAAAPLCAQIQKILRYRKFTIKQDSKGRFWFDSKETKALATETATIHYSEDEVEFFNKVSEIIDNINEFEKWAQIKGFDPFFTEQRSVIWNGGTVTDNIISILTDTELTAFGGVNTKNHLTFNAEVFRELLNKGFVNQSK